MAGDDEVPALQVRNLDFSYGPVQVLFDVSFDVAPGEVVALLGTNGLAVHPAPGDPGLGIPDRGVVRLNGRTITYAEAETRFRWDCTCGGVIFPVSLSVTTCGPRYLG